jgi:hypothetical protein
MILIILFKLATHLLFNKFQPKVIKIIINEERYSKIMIFIERAAFGLRYGN